MNSINLNSKSFEKSIFLRGEEYFLSGKVKIVEVSKTLIQAEVLGSRRYQVRLRFLADGHFESTFCNCPYASSHNYCKHMAAALFAHNDYLQRQVDEQTEVEVDLSCGTFLQRLNTFSSSSVNRFFLYLKKGLSGPGTYWDEEEIVTVLLTSANYLQRLSFNELRLGADLFAKLLTEYANYLNPEAYVKIVSALPSGMSRTVLFASSLNDGRLHSLLDASLSVDPSLASSELKSALDSFPSKEPYSPFSCASLEILAKNFFFSSQDERLCFVRECQKKGANEALLILLESNQFGALGSVVNEILSYLASLEDPSFYKRAMQKAIGSSSIPLSESIRYLHTLSGEEKESFASTLRNAYKYSEDQYAILLLLDPSSFGANEFTHLPLSVIPALESEIRSKGPSFYVKALKRRLEKQLKQIESYRGYDEDYLSVCAILTAFADESEIAAYFSDSRFVDASMRKRSFRLAYLEAVEKRSTPSRAGLYIYGGRDHVLD